MTLEEFDHIVNVDYRGSWLCSREELKVMVNQEPLETHDGRKGSRGAIVNVASQLGIVARPQARKFANPTLAVDVYDTDMIYSGRNPMLWIIRNIISESIAYVLALSKHHLSTMRSERRFP